MPSFWQMGREDVKNMDGLNALADIYPNGDVWLQIHNRIYTNRATYMKIVETLIFKKRGMDILL